MECWPALARLDWKSRYYCNIFETQLNQLRPHKPGLGQGVLEYWSVGFKNKEEVIWTFEKQRTLWSPLPGGKGKARSFGPGFFTVSDRRAAPSRLFEGIWGFFWAGWTKFKCSKFKIPRRLVALGKGLLVLSIGILACPVKCGAYFTGVIRICFGFRPARNAFV